MDDIEYTYEVQCQNMWKNFVPIGSIIVPNSEFETLASQ